MGRKQPPPTHLTEGTTFPRYFCRISGDLSLGNRSIRTDHTRPARQQTRDKQLFVETQPSIRKLAEIPWIWSRETHQLEPGTLQNGERSSQSANRAPRVRQALGLLCSQVPLKRMGFDSGSCSCQDEQKKSTREPAEELRKPFYRHQSSAAR